MTAACPDALRENSQSQIISARVAYLLPFAVRPQSHDAQACSSSASQQILTGGPIRQPTAHHVRSRQPHPPFSRSLIHDSMNAGEAAEFTQSIVIMSRADHGPSIKFTFLPFSHYVSLTWSRIRMKLIQIRFIERLLFVLSNTPRILNSYISTIRLDRFAPCPVVQNSIPFDKPLFVSNHSCLPPRLDRS